MKLLKPLFTLIILALAVFAIYYWIIFPLFSQGLFDGKASVIHVVDSDSLMVMQNGKVKNIQLIGVNAPETSNTNSKECYADEAKEEVVDYFRKDREVTVESDKELGDKDIYGRFLRYVKLSDDRYLNEELLKEGLAKEYHSTDDSYSKKDQFEELESEAKEDRRGLWAECM